MAAQIPPIQAHSTVEVDDSCNDCSPCCWPRRMRKIKKDNDKFIAEMEDATKRDSHDTYNITVYEKRTPEPVVKDIHDIIAQIQDKK